MDFLDDLNDLTPKQLVGRKVAFKMDAEHAGCWHYQASLATGVILRPAQSLAQKAELLGTEGIEVPEWLGEVEEVPRLWVKADPCAAFPRGCEVAVEKGCLTLIS